MLKTATSGLSLGSDSSDEVSAWLCSGVQGGDVQGRDVAPKPCNVEFCLSFLCAASLSLSSICTIVSVARIERHGEYDITHQDAHIQLSATTVTKQ